MHDHDITDADLARGFAVALLLSAPFWIAVALIVVGLRGPAF